MDLLSAIFHLVIHGPATVSLLKPLAGKANYLLIGFAAVWATLAIPLWASGPSWSKLGGGQSLPIVAVALCAPCAMLLLARMEPWGRQRLAMTFGQILSVIGCSCLLLLFYVFATKWLATRNEPSMCLLQNGWQPETNLHLSIRQSGLPGD
jgi:hypothetical protein